jgi:hypothetical protein
MCLETNKGEVLNFKEINVASHVAVHDLQYLRKEQQ